MVIQQVQKGINRVSPENIKILRDAINEKAKTIQLESTYWHPIRNHHAHIYGLIKQHFGRKYSFCFDDEFEQILAMINSL